MSEGPDIINDEFEERFHEFADLKLLLDKTALDVLPDSGIEAAISALKKRFKHKKELVDLSFTT